MNSAKSTNTTNNKKDPGRMSPIITVSVLDARHGSHPKSQQPPSPIVMMARSSPTSLLPADTDADHAHEPPVLDLHADNLPSIDRKHSRKASAASLHDTAEQPTSRHRRRSSQVLGPHRPVSFVSESASPSPRPPRAQAPSFDEAVARLETDVPNLPLSIEEGDLFGSAVVIALELFPAWKEHEQDLVVSRCTDGITNKLVKIKNPRADNQTILLRCYGHGTSAIINRKNELVSLMMLSEMGFAPPLYGRFQNGFCYGFVEGHVLTPDELANNDIGVLIARHLARWHRLRMPAKNGTGRAAVWKTMHDWLDQVPSTFAKKETQEKFMEHESILAPDVVRRELRSLQTTLEEQTSSPIVFCHNDLLAPNIIYREKEQEIAFIDYEYGAYSYRGFDIANHFNEWAGFECDYSRYPSDEQQAPWIQSYLRETLQREPMEEDVTDLYREVNKFSLVSHFYWAIWALVQASVSDIDFDYMSYAVLRFSEYYRRKQERLAL